ncbi:MAG: DNA methyltransferase [Nitrospinota bacterium]
MNICKGLLGLAIRALIYMAIRLLEVHRVLKPTGSIYLHCDPTMSHYLKLLLDSIFGEKNFRNEIIWCYEGRELSKKRYNTKHDTLFYYTKSKKWVFNWFEIGEPLKESSRKAMSRFKDAIGRHYILRYKNGGGFAPKEKEGTAEVYMQYVPEKIPSRDWVQIDYERKNKRQGYPTQKPVALLERIIKASSNVGDIVLDPFCGCATTCIAAEKLDREWVGIDISKKAYDLVKDRLQKEVPDPEDLYKWKKKVIYREDIPERTDTTKSISKGDNKHYLFGKQEGICNGCKTRFDYRNFTIDHIVPSHKGGGDNIENLQLLCGHCNSTKGTETMPELLNILKTMKILK